LPRVLFFAYHFPPIGGAGVQRYVKLIRYLADAGYDSVVVTGPGAVGDRWAPEDRSLASSLPPTVEVHRVQGPPPDLGPIWAQKGRRLTGSAGPWHRWWVEGCAELGARVGTKCDIVFGGLQPYEMAEGVGRAAAELRKPWVADLADPWALDEMRLYPTAWHRRKDLATMRRLLSTAAAIVMNTPEAARRVCEQLPELAGRVTEPIPNGFDPVDFADVSPTESDTRFRIVHTGYLHTALGLAQRRHAGLKRLLRGEPVPGTTILSRSHVYLLEAAEIAIQRRPELADSLEISLAGVLSDVDVEIAQQSPYVRLLGYVSHAESVALLKSASLLFLPMQAMPPGTRSGIVPGKTYEYLGAGRPILAAVPQGDARDLLRAAGNALLCDPDDAEAMSTALLRASKNGVQSAARPEVVATYDWKKLAARLASILDEVAARADSHAG
jgi:glycosyltransferase involved in cell wall biosynthesis